jgi:hypothetical protein
MINRDRKTKAPTLGVLFIALVFAFPRTLLEIKLIILTLLIINLAVLTCSRKILVPRHVCIFYGTLVFVGFLAAFVGAIRGNSTDAISDGIRLYIFWSILNSLLLTYYWQYNTIMVLHYGILLAAFTTSTLNITLVVSSFAGWTVFPESFSEALLLKVGIHDGYVQIVAHNIGMLLFIVPYLLVTALRTDSVQENRWLVWLALFVALITTALSGRRALWIVTVVTPLLIWFLAIATDTCNRIKAFPLYSAVILGLLVIAIIFPLIFFSEDTLSYLYSAFSAEDERSIQKRYLIDGFLETPLFGSGFGGVTDYVRSQDSPWVYELSFHQMLFNFGFIGSVFLVVSLLCMFIKAIEVIKVKGVQVKDGVISVLLGTVGLLIGAYSNPYLGSFDYLLALGFLPLVISDVPKRIFRK